MATASDFKIPPLDTALKTVDDTSESRANLIKVLAGSVIYVLADKPWDKHSPPDSSMRLLLVSDGPNQLQPMLAVFSNPERANKYLEDNRSLQHPFQHVLEVEMGWASLGIPLRAGVMLNPNSERSFRISPEVSAKLRDAAQMHVSVVLTNRLAQHPKDTQDKQIPILTPEIESAQAEIHKLIADGKIQEAELKVTALETSGTPAEHTLCLRALIARQQADYKNAALFLRTALDKARDTRLLANIWWILGQILDEDGESQEAEHAYFQAQTSDPGELTYAMSLASILAKNHRLNDALTLLREQMKIHASDPAPAAQIAQLLVENDQYDIGLETLNELITKYPGIAGLHYNRAACLQMLGDIEKATLDYELALRLDPNLDGHSQYVHARKFLPGELSYENMYIKMLELRSQSNMPINSRIDADFALAKLYDLMGDYDRAFAHMHSGNGLKRSTFKKYSIEKAKDEIATILDLYTKNFLDRFKNTATSEIAPIFILGMPRSGTTLTEQILAAHSGVNAGSEMIYFGELADEFTKNWAGYSLESDQQHDKIVRGLKQIVSGYTERTSKLQTPNKRFTDKMPGNYLNIGLIYLLFPNASIIHCQRNPMDICLSCYEHLFSKGLPYSYDLRELGEYYKTYLGAMRSWRNILPEQFILDVQYEQVVGDPENQIRRILDFCGLDFEEACLDFHKVKRSVKTASSVQVRQPLYKTSVNRWHNYRKHLGLLIETLGPEIVVDGD
jgi:Flp pilus assembly protein TadD